MNTPPPNLTGVPTLSAAGGTDPGYLDCCVAVCTRNRAEQLSHSVRSLVAECPTEVPIIIVDQSSDGHSERVVQQFAAVRNGIVYVRQALPGVARARNAAVLAAPDRDVVVFTDDDCVVRPGWLTAMLAPFADESVGIAFGNVVPRPVAPEVGFIVGHNVGPERTIRGRLGKLRDGGIGANMAVRASAAVSVGLFDEMLGPGARFASNEEGDLAYRLLKAGHALAHAPSATVDHDGLRLWEEGSALARSTFFAVGAAYAKHLRQGDPVAALLIGQQAAFCIGEIVMNAAHLRKPRGAGRLLSLFRGAIAGLRVPSDPSTGKFC